MGGLAHNTTSTAGSNQVVNLSSMILRWLEMEGAYYTRYPNEIVYGHTLVKAMRAIQADIAGNDLATNNPEASAELSNPPKESL